MQSEKARILTIEDDPAIRRGIVDALKASNMIAWQAAGAKEGLQMALGKPCDLILLDLVLPGGDGLDVLARIRKENPTLPVIILTARGESSDRVRGLRLGADDYVVKPFSVDELLARIEAVLRRSPARMVEDIVMAFPAASFDWTTRLLHCHDGKTIELSERESKLLQYLARHCDRVIDRPELLRGVWQIEPQGVQTRTVDVHVARLREKLAGPSAHIEPIQTIRGKGYQLNPKLVSSKGKSF